MAALTQHFKSWGTYVLGCLGMLGIALLCLLLIRGMVWVSDKVLPWLVYVSLTVFAFGILVFLPLSIFRRTRPFAGFYYFFSSYVFGATVWAYSCLIAYEIWGYAGLFVGLALAGIGVVPIACLATIFHGEWGTLGAIIVGIVLTFGARLFAMYLFSEKRQPTNVSAAD